MALAPGTSYHYRLVATSSVGTSYGADHSFATPGPVEATTGGAESVGEETARLTGAVNPRGFDAKYHFEYGTTTAYGESTGEGDAGAGAGNVNVGSVLTELAPGTTYHYRLVASNGYETSRGADDTFKTLPVQRPAALVHGDGSQDVFFAGSGGAVGDLNHKSLWSLSEFGGGVTVQGNESVVESAGTQDVFFTGSTGQIYEGRLVSGVWTVTGLGNTAAPAAGSPSAVVLNEGAIEVFYRATNNGIYVLWASSGAGPWTLVSLGGEAGSDPTAEVYHANNTVNVYFVGSNGQLWAMWAANGNAPFGLGQLPSAPAGAAPAPGAVGEIEQSNGGHSVWYRSTEKVIWEAWWNPANAQWTYSRVGGEAAGEPTALLKSNGWADLYYRGTDAAIHQAEIQPGVGVTIKSVGSQPATGDPIAVEANGYQDIYFYSGPNTVLAWLQGSGGFALANATPSVAPTSTTRPAALVHGDGSQDVFFAGSGGAVGDLNHKSLWSLSEFGGGVTVQGNESVVESAGTQDVFFTGSTGQIYEGRLVSGVWTVTGLGNTAAPAAGSPSAVVLNEGAIEVFYRATNNGIYVLWASSGAGPWTLVSLGGEAGSDPTAEVYHANNTVNVYFVGSNGQLWAMWAANGNAPFGLGQLPSAPAGAAPAPGAVGEIEQSNGGHSVWYRSTEKVIWEAWWNPANAQWTYSRVGGEAAGEPTALLKSNGWADLYYRGTDAAIHQAEIQPGVGVTIKSVGSQPATGDPIAVEANGYQDIYFADGNAVDAWLQGSGGFAFANLGIGAGII